MDWPFRILLNILLSLFNATIFSIHTFINTCEIVSCSNRKWTPGQSSRMLPTKSKTELLGTYVLQTVNTSTLEVEDKDTSSQCTATQS